MRTSKLICFIILFFSSGIHSVAFSKAIKTQTVKNINSSQKNASLCPITQAQVDLNINQVRARILVAGDLWWDPYGQISYYEVPKGSNKNSLYCGAIWIGGFDASHQLLTAAQTYRQAGANDFWGGPISKNPNNGNPEIAFDRCMEFDRLWSIKKSDVENFIANGNTTPDMESWPGNGNVSNGELPFLAPFFDSNNDGEYNFLDGDYPYFKMDRLYPMDPNTNEVICNDYLFGDQCVWWVFNDVGNVKSETNSAPIGLEIRAQAFAFDTEDDLDFVTFYKYQIINRSNSSLDSTYFGIWTDSDLGNASDDYVGCDVGLGMGFTYNGDPDDDGGGGYGLTPPAVGVDFLQGPLADPFDGIDNNHDGTIDEVGEQITMTHFMYYEGGNNMPNTFPSFKEDYYSYLRGTWLNGTALTYGGSGLGTGPGTTNIPCDFMFPGTSDPLYSANWTMQTANIQPTDMRWLQSVGAFTLLPGAVNYISTGVIWARAQGGGPEASVTEMKRADVYVQKLFDRCFEDLVGPHAPDLAIRELDKKIILSLENTINKNVELYSQFDKSIPGLVANYLNDSIASYSTLSVDERSYKFQGYKVYQVLNADVTVDEIEDESKAKLIAQIDARDDVKQVVNFYYDFNLRSYVPSLKASEVNNGIKHNLLLTQDLFSLKPVVNYRPYYFMVITYATNNFLTFDALNPRPGNSQAEPYLQSSQNVKVYSAIPHPQVIQNGGTVLNLNFGDGFKIKRIEGSGNGGNILDLSVESVNEILSSADHRAIHPVYQAGNGPIAVYAYDPLHLKGGGFQVQFNGVENSSRYFIRNLPGGDVLDSSIFDLSSNYELLLEENKIAFDIHKVNDLEPGTAAIKNGFLEATQTFNPSNLKWLTGVKDVDASSTKDWILSGAETSDLGDALQVFEKVLDGTWAPYKLASRANIGSPKFNTPALDALTKWNFLASVDVIFTSDKNNWTRCVIVETGEDNMPNVAAAKKFDKRQQASVDKSGNTGDGIVSTTDPNDADFISALGMGWFPGYAINIETGERLNIVFGENSSLVNENSTDMLFNPTSNGDVDVNGQLAFGGMHFIYIFNKNGTALNDVNIYDEGRSLNTLLSLGSLVGKRNAFKDCIWTSLPLLQSGHAVLESEVKIRLRVVKDYKTFISIGATAVNTGNPLYEFEVAENDVASTMQMAAAKSALDLIRVVPNPYYGYSTYENTRADQSERKVRITNLPAKCIVSIYTINGTLIRQFKRNVPSDVSDGYAVHDGSDFNLASTLDWDLKNESMHVVAGGVYIIHVDAGILGEKVVKWFGVIRPGDLDSY